MADKPVRCPLCRGLRRLPADKSGTPIPERQCILCEGSGQIVDRSGSLPASKRGTG